MKHILFSALLLAPSFANAQIYKCTDEFGGTSFQQAPCENATSKEEVIGASKKRKNNAVPIYPGATLKSKDTGDGFIDYFEYKTNDAFQPVVDYYLESAGKENCKKRSSYQYNCKYKEVPGYKHAEVAIGKESGRTDIIVLKTIK